MFEITNELPETRLTISVDKKGRVTIKTDFGVYDLMSKTAEEFPVTPKQTNKTTLRVPGVVLKQIIESTLFAVSKDELKPALTGVLFQFSKDGFTAVSTDGHRLVKYTRKDFQTKNLNGEVIVPRKFLSYLLNQLTDNEMTLTLGENHLTAELEKNKILTKIIDEKFPDYNSVIPKENNKVFTVEKNVLLGAIRRVSIFSNKSTHQVALSLNKMECFITTEDPEKSSKAKEEISGDFQGDEIKIGYNAEYLKDIVSHTPGSTISISQFCLI